MTTNQQPTQAVVAPDSRHVELLVFAALLALCNLRLLYGAPAAAMVYFPDRVAMGEWYRLWMHPFVHVSAYHLALDGGAFLLLYGSLQEAVRWWRVITVALCGVGALAVSQLTVPTLATTGLCGLSGIAHGLMAVSCLEAIQQARSERGSCALPAALFVGLVVKCAVEALSGQVVFAGLHLGSVGDPVTACHAGGVLGGVAAQAVGRKAVRLSEGGEAEGWRLRAGG